MTFGEPFVSLKSRISASSAVTLISAAICSMNFFSYCASAGLSMRAT